MIRIFEAGDRENKMDFGLGMLDPYSCIVHEEKNGDYSLTMEIDRDDEFCENERILLAPTPKHGVQKFRIYNVKKTVTGVKAVYARHIFYDLMDNFIDVAHPTNYTGTQAMERLFKGLQFEQSITGSSNITTVNTAYWDMMNPVEALIGNQENSFVNRWGGILDRDNRTFTINDEQLSPINIIYGKNLEDCGLSADISEAVTRIMPTGLKADGQTVLKLPERYVDSPRINNYVNPKVQRKHYSDIKVGENEGEYATEEEAFDALRARATAEFESGIDLPKISGTVSIIDLLKTKEYENAKGLEEILPFTPVRVWIWGSYVEAEMQAYDYNALSQQYESITIGVKDRFVGETMESQLYNLAQKVNLLEETVRKMKGA